MEMSCSFLRCESSDKNLVGLDVFGIRHLAAKFVLMGHDAWFSENHHASEFDVTIPLIRSYLGCGTS